MVKLHFFYSILNSAFKYYFQEFNGTKNLLVTSWKIKIKVMLSTNDAESVQIKNLKVWIIKKNL